MPISHLTTATENNGKSIYWYLFSGESVPIEYTFPEETDLTGDSFKVVVAGKEYEMTITDQTIKCVIPSVDTLVLEGNYVLNVWHTMLDENKQVIISGDMHVKKL